MYIVNVRAYHYRNATTRVRRTTWKFSSNGGISRDVWRADERRGGAYVGRRFTRRDCVVARARSRTTGVLHYNNVCDISYCAARTSVQ